MKFVRREDRRFSPEKVRLPLIALIDVVFFLLIYFVIAGTMAGEEAQLASALRAEKGAGKGSDLSPQILFVEPGAAGKPRYRLGDRAVEDRTSLTNVLKQLPRENGVIVRVAPGVTVDAAAAALQATKDAGFVKVSYVPGK